MRQSMNRNRFILAMMLLTGLSLLIAGCGGVNFDKKRSQLLLKTAAMKQVLMSLGEYYEKNSSLPATLEELQKFDSGRRLQKINVSIFTYHAAGDIAVDDGSLWHLAVVNPKDQSEWIVGRFEPGRRDPKTQEYTPTITRPELKKAKKP